ncbi:vanadium-dependent haloperoxidase [Variovorax sp. J31P207]|uniref:vanadium-dependent haloperoxidase n=1 Tax=Variovorax sp. J31P207 TaxID=3053510 RepID=UPI002576041D|nr:vanadium-dependent haloperoxidase [Variovorax sp. J31P207]MDM0066561.1 phosphatase PAP2 family protein [Variovorax sp. J31P207]
MNRRDNLRALVAAISISTAGVVACGGGGGGPAFVPAAQDKPVTITSLGTNTVDLWNKVAADTVTVPAATSGTPEERQPLYDADMATLNVAIYDALAAITKAYRPFMVTMPDDPARGSLSQDYAVHGAAYTVLSTLFPSRSAKYQPTNDAALAAADSDAQAALQFGAEVARKVLAQRANDGRWTPVPAYVPGTAPGQFRGVNPVGLTRPYLRPFSLRAADQFRASGPPALDSAAYAADVGETRTMGSASSTQRTDAQTENARFHTEAPPLFWTRNLRQFATSKPTLVENARLMALLWVALADASTACFESKYHFNFWRPTTAIRLAETDGNAATEPDPQWTPVVTTPNHPEYPAAHACNAGALGEALRQAFGTSRVQFTFNSTVTGTTHPFDSVEAMSENVQQARIHGGMHFRTATVHGRALGEKVVQQLLREHFTAASP